MKMFGTVLLVGLSTATHAECITARYRDGACVDLAPFVCTETKSSFVNRVCYDKAQTYMLILLKSTWYHYCAIPEETATELVAAESVGRFRLSSEACPH